MQRIAGVLAALAVVLSISFEGRAAEPGGGQRNASRHFSLNISDPFGQDQNAGNASTTIIPPSTPRPTISTVRMTPLTRNEKARYYLRSTYGPAAFGYTALTTGIKQAQGSVPEWGGGMEGYGRRYASSFGQKAINRSIRIGLQGLLHEEPRYIASGRSSLWSRALYAASEAFWVRKDSGGIRIAYTRFIGNFSAAYISRQWQPDRYHTTGDYLTSGLTSIGLDVAKNIWSEFWPDIRKRIHH
jgi:hypothetical protein